MDRPLLIDLPNPTRMSNTVLIQAIHEAADFVCARALFREYAASLDIDLCFQNFERELDSLEQQYAPPQGALFLARVGTEAVGCAAVRRFEEGVAELKRMYVQPAFRGQGISRQLLDTALDTARHLGYRQIRLDSLPSMQTAIALYRSAGFTEIPAYRSNPVAGTVYLEKNLVF